MIRLFLLLTFTIQIAFADLSPEISTKCGEYPQAEYDQSTLIESTCFAPNIKIYSVDPISSDLVCQGVKRAKKFFLKKLKFSLRPIEIYIVPEVPNFYLESYNLSFDNLLGLVDTRDLRMYMPTLDRFLTQDFGLMELPLNEEFYISYAAHETTHVLAQHHFKKKCLLMSSEQQEFIAYTVQLSTMEESLRQEVLTAFANKKWHPFEKINQISKMYHGMNPHGFAVKSYLFYQTEDGKKAFSDFLKGKIAPNIGDF